MLGIMHGTIDIYLNLIKIKNKEMGMIRLRIWNDNGIMLREE